MKMLSGFSVFDAGLHGSNFLARLMLVGLLRVRRAVFSMAKNNPDQLCVEDDNREKCNI